VLPPNEKIAKDAKESVQECVSEFISFITSEASDRCQQEKRKTINGDDLLWAMDALGFADYCSPLKLYLAKYRQAAKTKDGESGGMIAAPMGGGAPYGNASMMPGVPEPQYGFDASAMADGGSGGGLAAPSAGLGRSRPPQAPPSAVSSSSASSSSASVTAPAIAQEFAQAVTNADKNAEAPSASKNGDGESSGRASRSRSRDALPTSDDPPPPPPQEEKDDAAQAK